MRRKRASKARTEKETLRLERRAKLWERRRRLVDLHYARGESIPAVASKLAVEFGCSARAIERDWEVRQEWINDVVPLSGQDVAGHRDAILASWAEIRQSSAELEALARGAKQAFKVKKKIKDGNVTKEAESIEFAEVPDLRSAVGACDLRLQVSAQQLRLLTETIGAGAGGGSQPEHTEEERQQVLAAARARFGGGSLVPMDPPYTVRTDDPKITPQRVLASEKSSAGDRLKALQDVLEED